MSPLKHRLIPVLLLQNGQLVRSEVFRVHQVIGNPVNEVRRFNEWNVDELIYLDITRDDDNGQVARGDHKVVTPAEPLEILDLVSESCFMPLTWGGRIRTVDHMRERFARGADKIAINTAAVREPELITAGARLFGSQAIVVSIDVAPGSAGERTVWIDGATVDASLDAVTWAVEAERLGAGELLLQTVARDGAGTGYDIELITAIANATSIPVIACSGVGTFEDYPRGIQAGAAAVAAANIWHFKELADRHGKRALERAGVEVRLGPRPGMRS